MVYNLCFAMIMLVDNDKLTIFKSHLVLKELVLNTMMP